MTSSRKKGQQSKLEKMVKLKGIPLISRKRRREVEEKTETSTEIQPEIEIGTGLRTDGGIDPGTKGGTDPEIEGEAAPMTTGRDVTDPGTEAEKEGEAGPEIGIITEEIMTKTRHPDIEEDLLVAKADLRMYLTSCFNFNCQSIVFQKMSFLINQSSLLRGQIISKQFRMLSTCLTQNFHKSPVSHEDSLDDLKKKPVKFTSSKAFNLNPHTAIGIRMEEDDTPWFQGPVIGFSLACFLIYFCILR